MDIAPPTESILICDIQESFQSVGIIYVNQVVIIEDDDDDTFYMMFYFPPNASLYNWKIIEFPVIFYSWSK